DFNREKREWTFREWEPGIPECLSFPVHDQFNKWFNILFPIREDDKTKGKRTTWKAKQPLFIPEETWAARRDAARAIFITEGPVKALALVQAGFLAIGLSGTYASEMTSGRKLRQLCRVLREKFEWFGRGVYLAFDADQELN